MVCISGSRDVKCSRGGVIWLDKWQYRCLVEYSRGNVIV